MERFSFSHMCLVKRIEKKRNRKLFYLIEKKNEMTKKCNLYKFTLILLLKKILIVHKKNLLFKKKPQCLDMCGGKRGQMGKLVKSLFASNFLPSWGEHDFGGSKKKTLKLYHFFTHFPLSNKHPLIPFSLPHFLTPSPNFSSQPNAFKVNFHGEKKQGL